MNPLFNVGMCILMHGVAYKVEEVKSETYLLNQIVSIHEQDREFKQYWLWKYIDTVAKKSKMSKNFPCRN